MKPTTLALTSLFLLMTSPVEASDKIRLYPGPAPGSESWTHQELDYYSPIFQTEVVTNVVDPTLTAFLPDADSANGAAVVIAPGGGFHALSINSEGNDVAKWLNAKGIAAFVLRYRLVPTGEDGVKEMMQKSMKREQIQQEMAEHAPLAGADGLAAMVHVRQHAAKYNINPNRIGFMGFSAGGAVTAWVALMSDEKSRPDFVAPIYAGLGELKTADVPDDVPPMFLVAASNDPLGLAADSIALYSKWLEANRPVELHMYATGGHGFGMKTQNLPSDTWIERFHDWFQTQQFDE